MNDDWQEEHKRLAELEERKNDGLGGLGLGGLGMGGMGGGGGDASTVHLPPPASRIPHPSSLPPPHHALSSIPPPGLEERGGGDLAESLAMLILGADPAIASVGGPAGPGDRSSGLPAPPSMPQQQHHQHHHPSQLPPHHQLTPPLMSIIKEVGLPNRPPPMMSEDGRDLSERAPPPRSSSPVIGSPPVRAVPIGTPPKQPMSHAMNHQQQIHHPTAVHVRAPVHHQHRYPPSFPERISPNTLLNIAVAGFPRGCQGPPLLPGGGGFRPFFGQPPPHRMGPHPGGPPPNHNHVPCPIIRHNTTHLHPQHRRMLTQRMQSRGGERGGRVGDWRSRDPYSNLMTQREKEWNYFEKMEKRQERDRDGVRKEHTTKLITPQVAKLEHIYRPVQFAGSLGKLTVSSVNNPRKMIDTVVTSRTDDEEKREKQVWNKRRQILYTVEKMYSLLLEVQDFEKRFMQTPEEQREALLERHKTHTLQLYSSLKEKEVSDEQCLLIMSVRKGKRLISRLIPFLPPLQAATVFGVTLLYLILSEGERMQSSDPNCQLMDDNRWTELVFSVTRELLNVPPSSLSPPLFTPPNLLSLFSRYVDRQRLELLQEKLQISALSR
ncbi:unnamed protein product [Coregonus sp. 'balchen']|nr:unnamed protein product [Coregonus sp. 'balchen']